MSGSGHYERHIADIAMRQHAVVTLDQLTAIGISSSAVKRRVRSDRMSRIHRGVFQVGPMTLPLTRPMAAVLACGPSALLSYDDAGALWSLFSAGGDGSVHVTVVGATRSRPNIRIHRVRSLGVDERAVHHGIPVTSPARTILDLAGRLGSREIENMLARAEREGLTRAEDVLSLLGRYPRRRGARALRAIIGSTGGPTLTRSPLEKEFAKLLRDTGLPFPMLNVPFGPYELDAFWPDLSFAVEVDGFAYHGNRARYEGDRQKDLWLKSRGITVLRLSWRQITRRPLATAVQLGQSLALARAAARRLPQV